MIGVGHLADPCVPNLQTTTARRYSNSFNKDKGQFRRTLKVSFLFI